VSGNFRNDSEKYHDYNIHVGKRLIFIDNEIDEFVASEFIKNMNLLDASPSQKEQEITLDINTPGGNDQAGWAIYDRIRQSPCYVTGRVFADCSSMGTIILQACDERIIAENVCLLFHEGTDAVPEKHSRDAESYLKQIPVWRKRMYDLYKQCTGLRRSQLESLVKMDKYVYAKQALELGFVDKILENEPPEWYNKRIKNK
jgi:ATP-dependent Clp protease protease subunit